MINVAVCGTGEGERLIFENLTSELSWRCCTQRSEAVPS